MQRIQEHTHRDARALKGTRLWAGLAGLFWVAGLMIAGSDSPYMPWVNGIGAFLFLGASLILSRLLPRLDPAGRKTRLQAAGRAIPTARDQLFGQALGRASGHVYGSISPSGKPARGPAHGTLFNRNRENIGTGYACEI